MVELGKTITAGPNKSHGRDLERKRAWLAGASRGRNKRRRRKRSAFPFVRLQQIDIIAGKMLLSIAYAFINTDKKK